MYFDHDIALDWAQLNMAIARMTKKGRKQHVIDVPSDITVLKEYLKSLRGNIRLTFEESTASQWLYTELKPFTDELIVCEPRCNLLMKDGPKTDKIDAKNLVRLMRAGMLKPVYHSGDDFIKIRKLVSGYQDLIQTGTRLKNQRAALFRGQGKSRKETSVEGDAESFVLSHYDLQIAAYEEHRECYIHEFEKLAKKHRVIRILKSSPGLGLINAVKVAAIVVDPRRFPHKGKFLAYCGLIKYDKISGGKIYGQRKPNYNRVLKNVFDTAAIACIEAGEDNLLRKDYLYLTKKKKRPEHNARHAIARKAAIIAWGVMKSNKPFDINKRRKDKARKDKK